MRERAVMARAGPRGRRAWAPVPFARALVRESEDPRARTRERGPESEDPRADSARTGRRTRGRAGAGTRGRGDAGTRGRGDAVGTFRPAVGTRAFSPCYLTSVTAYTQPGRGARTNGGRDTRDEGCQGTGGRATGDNGTGTEGQRDRGTRDKGQRDGEVGM